MSFHMHEHFKHLLLLVAIYLIPTQSFALIYSIAKYEDANGKKITVMLDSHFFGSKSQNLEQMERFLSRLKHRVAPTHLLIESKFFFGARNAESIDDVYKEISSLLMKDTKWSFDQSPQHPLASTWIAWHLPFRLLSQPIDGITYNFCDPRLVLDSPVKTFENVSWLHDYANKKRLSAINQTPEEKLGEVSTLFFNNNHIDSVELFDTIIGAETVNYIYVDKPENTDLLIICGCAHHKMLEMLILTLGFNVNGRMSLPVEILRSYGFGVEINNEHFSSTISFMDFY